MPGVLLVVCLSLGLVGREGMGANSWCLEQHPIRHESAWEGLSSAGAG